MESEVFTSACVTYSNAWSTVGLLPMVAGTGSSLAGFPILIGTDLICNFLDLFSQHWIISEDPLSLLSLRPLVVLLLVVV
ncbi:hypothetical protein R1flu_008499 [Riccia fluitans]|uniref:Uncharacterized protein n=1 Tax=Riccia fluitans TaxID=41844 RepID=A0ABD1YBV4_9MARC